MLSSSHKPELILTGLMHLLETGTRRRTMTLFSLQEKMMSFASKLSAVIFYNCLDENMIILSSFT